MGKAAVADIREAMRLLAEKERIRIVFAAAPSQNECLAALIQSEGLDWSRVTAFHMDEYIGLPVGPAAVRELYPGDCLIGYLRERCI